MPADPCIDTSSRRRVLRLAGGAAAGGVAATAGALAAPPSAARDVSYRPGRYARTLLLKPAARHLVNRFTYGITPETVTQVRVAGGHLAWFDQQLATAYDGSADGLADWWPDLHLGPTELWSRNTMGVRGGWEVMWDYGNRVLARRILSPRQVLEVMTEFWENHFHVPSNYDNIHLSRIEYGETIRRLALGRFEDLLQAAIVHPAMLTYLNAASSTKAHPNENLGRELLELYTLGVGNYTEDDVKASARILTGHRVDLYRTWAYSYQPKDHWIGPVTVAGFSDPNADADGREVCRRFLSHLAHHPATARRIATKLIRAFVSDTVPPGLVDRLAAVYLQNDTAIVPVLRELVRSPEFRSSAGTKVRDADDDVVATYRVLGVGVRPPRSDASAANQLYWQAALLGLAPFTWPRPDGQPVDNASWSSATRALASMALHWDVATGAWPGDAVTFPRSRSWLPRRRTMRFRDLVDHLSRRLLYRESTRTLLEACCEAVAAHPDDLVGPSSSLVRTRMPRLVATILDSPAFLQR